MNIATGINSLISEKLSRIFIPYVFINIQENTNLYCLGFTKIIWQTQCLGEKILAGTIVDATQQVL